MIEPHYLAKADRYEKMKYRSCGMSGLKLPLISLGLWHNFGHTDLFATAKETALTAFDNGITHFDLANNYGPPYGSAEENFGRILDHGLRTYRDELIISSKAGYDMWPGPYGDGSSRKYLIASCEQSLKRMGLDYVDVFYSHRYDPDTPLEETMLALDHLVRQGKALYVGISNYDAEQTRKATEIFESLGTPFVIHQAKYSMFDRTPEHGLLDVLSEKQKGLIVYSPLAQGLLTNRYLKGIPTDSRVASSNSPFLSQSNLDEATLSKIIALNGIAIQRQQSLAQMALSWLLRNETVTSVLVGASSSAQLLDNIQAYKNIDFSADEIAQIEAILV